MSDQTKTEAVVVEPAAADATVAAPEVAKAKPKAARKPKAAKPKADAANPLAKADAALAKAKAAKSSEDAQESANPWNEPVTVTMERALVVLAAEAVLTMVDYPPDLNSDAANTAYDEAAVTALNDLCDALGVDTSTGPHSELAAMRDAAFGGIPRMPRRKPSKK